MLGGYAIMQKCPKVLKSQNLPSSDALLQSAVSWLNKNVRMSDGS